MSPKATRAVEDAARKIVWARDGHLCQLCGRSILNFPSNTHHRMNRGAGGSALLERPSLLIRLCGSGTTYCHGWVTQHPKLAGQAAEGGTGYLLPRNNPDIDPTQEPIWTYLWGWVLLDDNGGRSPWIGEVPA